MKTKKVLTVVLFLLALFLILFLTFQNTEKSSELSESIALRIVRFLRVVGSPLGRKSGLICIYVRKIAHTLEYFLLGIAAMLLFRKSPNSFLKAAALCAVVSFADQSIKSFLPGREFDWTDFPYDIAGYVSGDFLTWLLDRKSSKQNQEEDRKT